MDKEINLIEEGKIRLEQKKYEEAEAIFLEALQINSDDQQACSELGKIRCIQKRYQEAIEKLERAIALDKDDTCAHFLLAKSYKETDRYQDAIAEFRKTIELNSREGNTRLVSVDEQVYFEMGNIYYVQQKYSAAIENLKKAITLDQGYISAHLLLAKSYKETDRYQDAIAEFRKTIELNSKEGNVYLDTVDEQSYFEMGNIYYVQQDYAKAIETLEKAIALDKNDTGAHFLLAKSYKETDRHQDAIAEFRKALELGYGNQHIHKELYAIYRDLQQFSQAAVELKKALDKGYEKELYQSDLDNIYRGQIRLIQSYNYEGRHPEVLKETAKASSIIGKDNPMFYNMLQNEIEIAQKKVLLSSRIRALTVTLTNKCNLSCIMCKTRSKPWDLPKKHIQEIIALFPYLERVMWQGGEVFLYAGFKDILKEAARFPMRKIIATNGLLIDREIAEILVKSNVELTFSIDGATKKVYEHIRSGAKFEKVIESVGLINELRKKLNPGMQTRLNVLVMRSNCHQIEEFLDFAKQHQFDTVFFNSTGEDFKNLNENIFCYSRDDKVISHINTIKTKIADKAREYNIRLENWLPSTEFLDQTQAQPESQGPLKSETQQTGKNEKLFCHVPWQRLYIDCEGLTRPDCLCPTEKNVGNILDNTLTEMWNGEKMLEYRRRITNNNYQGFCHPDCVFGRVAEKNLKFV